MICFIWDGFPQYAARCVGAFVRAIDERVVVIASRPSVPIRGMESLCGCEVIWIDYSSKSSLVEMLGVVPRFALVSGWFSPTINRWRDEVRAEGGNVVAMCDNNWPGFSILELVKAIRFRLLLRNRYDGFLVPGISGAKLLRFYGVHRDKIVTGLYAADSKVFHDGIRLSSRNKRIICVARFIDWKNAKRLILAFEEVAKEFKDWSLELFGSGPLRNELINTIEQFGCTRIHIHDFLQPEQLAEQYREARIFCLPSLHEHWGLVVHEGALSGCVLLLSKNVGAAEDLLIKGINGITFDPYKISDITSALVKAMKMSDEQLWKAQETSCKMAMNFGLEKFVASVKNIMNLVLVSRDDSLQTKNWKC